MLRAIVREVVLFVACAFFTATVGLIVVDTVIMPRLVRKGQQVSVPDIVDLTPAQARQKLSRHGLRLKLEEPRWDASVSKGKIAYQNPKAFSKVKPGRTVYGVESLGVRSYAVPDVRQKSMRQARLWIEQTGLALGEVTEAPSNRVREGLVLQQTPAPGSAVETGTIVTLVLSSGPPRETVLAPSVVGARLADARARISEAGLRVGEVRYAFSTAYEPNVVVEQTPAAGEEVKQGTRVRLVVSKL